MLCRIGTRTIKNFLKQPEQTGLMDEITRQALLDFQQLNALPMTGVLDKHTWKHLALHYSAAAAHDAIRG